MIGRIHSNSRKAFHTLGVLLYVLIGISSAWHAPHFFRDGISLDADRHAQHEIVTTEACALCTVKSSSQIVSSGFSLLAASFRYAAPQVSAVRFVTTEPDFAGRPRAPPALS